MANVLLVDDDAMVQWALDEALSDAGHLVMQASTGATAGELIDQNPMLDLLVTDIALAGPVNGLQLSRYWRGKSGLPTVFITGFTQSDAGVVSMDKRDVYLRKPFRAEELIGLVERLVAQHPKHRAGLSWRASPREPRAI